MGLGSAAFGCSFPPSLERVNLSKWLNRERKSPATFGSMVSPAPNWMWSCLVAFGRALVEESQSITARHRAISSMDVITTCFHRCGRAPWYTALHTVRAGRPCRRPAVFEGLARRSAVVVTSTTGRGPRRRLNTSPQASAESSTLGDIDAGEKRAICPESMGSSNHVPPVTYFYPQPQGVAQCMAALIG